MTSERIRHLRKSVRLSQTAFGARIGTSRDSINNVENGRVTPTDVLLRAICSEFGVSFSWLKNGDGEMWESKSDDVFDRLSSLYHLTALERRIIQTYCGLPQESRSIVQQFIESVFSPPPSDDYASIRESILQAESQDEHGCEKGSLAP